MPRYLQNVRHHGSYITDIGNRSCTMYRHMHATLSLRDRLDGDWRCSLCEREKKNQDQLRWRAVTASKCPNGYALTELTAGLKKQPITKFCGTSHQSRGQFRFCNSIQFQFR